MSNEHVLVNGKMNPDFLGTRAATGLGLLLKSFHKKESLTLDLSNQFDLSSSSFEYY